MESYRTEEEQVEALKRWWDENGRSTITAVIFALALGFGWQGWQQYREDSTAAASDTYQSMLQSFSGQDEEGANALAEELKTDYAGTTYAQFAALHLARNAVEKGDLATAEQELRWVTEQADESSETYRVAQLRLARVLADSDPARALEVLAAADPGSFQAAFQVARGDILMLQEQHEAAKEAYSSAVMLASRGGEQVNMAFLQQKLQSLSPESPQPVGESTAAGQPAEPAANEAAPATAEESP